MNNTNLAKGGEPRHQIIEPYQQETHGKSKQNKTKQNKQKEHRFPNYSGHHMKGSYQKAQKRNGDNNKRMFKPFWTPHEGIISKKQQHTWGKTKKQRYSNLSGSGGPWPD